MQAIRVQDYGSVEVMRLEELPDPVPQAGQVVVAVEVAGVGYGDVIVRSGGFPMPLPWIPGVEVGGTVAAVGPGGDASLLGRRVVATTLNNAGGYASLALAEPGNVFLVPDGLDLQLAVPVFQAGALAVGILAAVRLVPGDTVLVTAAAGRIGSLLVQVAKAAGARVIGAAGGPEKSAHVLAFGADHAVDYRQPGWDSQVRDLTRGRGVDVALDGVAGEVGTAALGLLAAGTGRIGLFGYSSGTREPLDVGQITRRGLTVVGAVGVAVTKPLAEQRQLAEQALRAAAEGSLTPRVHRTFPLADAPSAHLELEQRRNVGAILLTV